MVFGFFWWYQTEAPTVGRDVGDAAFDGLWDRTPGNHVYRWVQGLARWGAAVARRKTRHLCFLIGQSSLEVVEPGLTTDLLFEPEGNVPDGKNLINTSDGLSQSDIRTVSHTRTCQRSPW